MLTSPNAEAPFVAVTKGKHVEARLLCRSISQRRKKRKLRSEMEKREGKLRVTEIELCFGFAWAWLALAGRKAIPWLFTSFRDFEPPEHVPRTLARAHICSQCSRGPPACPVIDSKRKNPRAEEQKMPMSKKSSYYTSQYALVFLVTTVSTAVQQVSGTGTRLPGTWYQPGTRLPIYLLPTAVPGTGILVLSLIHI